MASRKAETREKWVRILSFVRSYLMAYEVGPSLDEITDSVNIPKTTLHYHMNRMEAVGYIKRIYIQDRAVGRQMEITDKGKAYLNAN